jgi:hypothetical protein
LLRQLDNRGAHGNPLGSLIGAEFANKEKRGPGMRLASSKYAVLNVLAPSPFDGMQEQGGRLRRDLSPFR